MMKELGYDFICTNCEKTIHRTDRNLPEAWTYGFFTTLDGYEWEPSIHLCGECWASPKVGPKEADGTFRKLAAKFGWLNRPTPTEKERSE